MSSQPASKKVVHNLELKVPIEKCVSELADDKCFSEEHRQYYNTFTISPEQFIHESELFKDVFNDFNGNQEKFYTKFNKKPIDNFVLNNLNLPEFLSRLLCTELSTAYLDFLMNRKVDTLMKGQD